MSDRHALCLSGGGYRAALFHLGVVTRLNQVGALGVIDTLSSVSGGSILSAHLITAIPDWPQPGSQVADWERTVVEPFLQFTRTNIRNKAVYRQIGNVTRSDGGVRALAKEYQSKLPLRRTIAELPQRPRTIFNCTDMQFGVGWTFDSGDENGAIRRCGDAMAGHAPLPDWPLGQAVAASSCFPPVFNPLVVGAELRLEHGEYGASVPSEDDPAKRHRSLPPRGRPNAQTLRSSIELSDGGVYDNMGVEAVWSDHTFVLVSDGGGVFEPSAVKRLYPLGRYIAVANNEGTDVRRRWLLTRLQNEELDGAYLGINSSPEDFPSYSPELRYPRELIEGYIATIRTDLDAFSVAEQCVLINHGYSLACAAWDSWLKKIPDIKAVVMNPESARWPYSDFAGDTEALKSLLDNSNRRRKLGHKSYRTTSPAMS